LISVFCCNSRATSVSEFTAKVRLHTTKGTPYLHERFAYRSTLQDIPAKYKRKSQARTWSGAIINWLSPLNCMAHVSDRTRSDLVTNQAMRSHVAQISCTGTKFLAPHRLHDSTHKLQLPKRGLQFLNNLIWRGVCAARACCGGCSLVPAVEFGARLRAPVVCLPVLSSRVCRLPRRNSSRICPAWLPAPAVCIDEGKLVHQLQPTTLPRQKKNQECNTSVWRLVNISLGTINQLILSTRFVTPEPERYMWKVCASPSRKQQAPT
jgi:hypothetical protein